MRSNTVTGKGASWKPFYILSARSHQWEIRRWGIKTYCDAQASPVKSLAKSKWDYKVSPDHIAQLTRHHPDRSDAFLSLVLKRAYWTSNIFVASEPHRSIVFWIDLHLNTTWRGNTTIFCVLISGYMKACYHGKIYELQFTGIDAF